jgi:hypothetical protein
VPRSVEKSKKLADYLVGIGPASGSVVALHDMNAVILTDLCTRD